MDTDFPPSPDKDSSPHKAEQKGFGYFWSELRRRKVVRVAITYAIVAWLIIQIASTTFEGFGIPVWAFRFVMLCVILGFPLVLIITWAFELTPDGIKTTRFADEARGDGLVSDKQQRKLNWISVIFGAAVPTVIFGAVALFFNFRAGPEASIPETDGVSDSRQSVESTAQQLVEIYRLRDIAEYAQAFMLAREVAPLLGEGVATDNFWGGFSYTTNIETDPQGASVYLQSFDDAADTWEELGATPLNEVRFAASLGYRLRFELEGYRPVELLRFSSTGGRRRLPAGFNPVRLDPIDVLPEEMVRIPGFTLELVDYDDYFMDRFEVTNREYQKFITAGGYRKREYWTQPFIRDGTEVPWEEGISAFVDETGRPGPSAWAGGAYPSGQGDYPVGGVSWYEAVAYANFVKKQLPTLGHFNQAIRFYKTNGWLVGSLSNLSSDGPRSVGDNRAMSTMGVYDLLGNVREWCWNEMENEERSTTGGAWVNAAYEAFWNVPASPWIRDATHGFRCIRSFDSEEKRNKLREPQEPWIVQDYRDVKPVSDTEFEIFKSLYHYDPSPLNSEVIEVVEFEDWKRERVAFDLPYGERGGAYVYLPQNAELPIETILFWPGAYTLSRRNVDEEALHSFIFLVRSGRAVVQPIFKGTYDRDDADFSITAEYVWEASDSLHRDFHIKWVQEVSRTIDYIETRDEFDTEKLGYLGLSWGGMSAPRVLATDNRIKVAVINSGGLNGRSSLPEVHNVNFVSRVDIPILMLNGEYDVTFPYETSQKPFFDLLGTDPQHKKFVSFKASHSTPRNGLIRESLAWFDAYLGDNR